VLGDSCRAGGLYRAGEGAARPLIAAAHAVECLVRRPESLAHLLEAAGGLALERAGAILDARVVGSGSLDPNPPAGCRSRLKDQRTQRT